jgi:hypothetical protein
MIPAKKEKEMQFNFWGHYMQRFVNRRCRKAYYSGRMDLYLFYYRESWRRYTQNYTIDWGLGPQIELKPVGMVSASTIKEVITIVPVKEYKEFEPHLLGIRNT